MCLVTGHAGLTLFVFLLKFVLWLPCALKFVFVSFKDQIDMPFTIATGSKTRRNVYMSSVISAASTEKLAQFMKILHHTKKHHKKKHHKKKHENNRGVFFDGHPTPHANKNNTSPYRHSSCNNNLIHPPTCRIFYLLRSKLTSCTHHRPPSHHR